MAEPVESQAQEQEHSRLGDLVKLAVHWRFAAVQPGRGSCPPFDGDGADPCAGQDHVDLSPMAGVARPRR